MLPRSENSPGLTTTARYSFSSRSTGGPPMVTTSGALPMSKVTPMVSSVNGPPPYCCCTLEIVPCRTRILRMHQSHNTDSDRTVTASAVYDSGAVVRDYLAVLRDFLLMRLIAPG